MWSDKERLGPFKLGACLTDEAALQAVLLASHDDAMGAMETLIIPDQPTGFRADVVATQAAAWVAACDGPCLVPLRELMILKGQLVARAPYYPDGTVQRRLKNMTPLSSEQACDIVLQGLVGLEQLHEAGIVHGRFHARHLHLDGAEIRLGGVSLDPFLYSVERGIGVREADRYVAPEERQRAQPTVATDIWAVGKTLEALLPPDAPSALRAVVQHCLKLQPEDRFNSAHAVRSALSGVLLLLKAPIRDEMPASVPTRHEEPERPQPKKTKPAKRSRGVALVAASILLVATIGWVVRARTSAVPKPTAEPPKEVKSVDPLAEGLRLRDQDKQAEALAEFTRVCAQQPTNAAAWYWRGQCALALRQPREARASFDKAIAISPTEGEYYGARGSAFEQLGQLSQAIEDYRTASRLDPQNRSHVTNLSRALDKKASQ